MHRMAGLSMLLVPILMAQSAAVAAPEVLVRSADGPYMERLAAAEVQRYVYQRTGSLLPLAPALPEDRPAILVGRKDSEPITEVLKTASDDLRRAVGSLEAEHYMIRVVTVGERRVMLITGGDSLGTLYGAYRLAEHLGVRFYMHGDVVPDRRVAMEEIDWDAFDELAAPLFDRRGIQPFHDFPEGPDWWYSPDAYKAILGQLPKMRMNFFGLHCYPEGGVGPEPLIWIGPPSEIGDAAAVKASYPSRHFTTANPTGSWGYADPRKTSEYHHGTAALYRCDDFGADYMRGMQPFPAQTPEQSNELFQRMGVFLGDVFTFARRHGIKTCIGTETPLTIPAKLRERLEAAGKDPKDPAVVREVYRGMFERIAQVHPLDYYWLWTGEGWTWRDVKQQQVDAVVTDLKTAEQALRDAGNPFTLATCGWVLGPPQNRALFDQILPEGSPVSCINRNVGHAPVEPGFAKVEGRPQWAIPWLEDDPAMIAPQLWVGRMRRDAFDALRYGCTGLFGIHWRTRELGPNVSALARAAWDQSSFAPEGDRPPKTRFLPCEDFYLDWATSQFGPEAAEPIAKLFAKVDGRLPHPSTWKGGPGGIVVSGEVWFEMSLRYAFVDELATLRDRIVGPGNLARFDWWLGQFRYLRAMGQVSAAWGDVHRALKQVEAIEEASEKAKLVSEQVLPPFAQMIDAIDEAHHHLLPTVTTMGTLGNVTNWQQHVIRQLVDEMRPKLEALLGEPLPAEMKLSNEYHGPPHMFLPVVRTSLAPGEPLRLDAVVLGAEPGAVRIMSRSLGGEQFEATALKHRGRGWWGVELPVDGLPVDGPIEYYVEAELPGGKTLRRPPTAPELNHSIVVVGGE